MRPKIVFLSVIIMFAFYAVNAQERDYQSNSNQYQEQGYRKDKRSHEKENYGTNILRIAPFSAIDIGAGFGLSYEKIFGRDHNIGFVIPMDIMFSGNGNDSYSGQNNNGTYVYFSPGIKVYPFGQRRVTYAVGPNLMLGFGGGHSWESAYGSANPEYISDSKFRFGMLINNYLNVQVSPVFSFGVQGGLGVRYIDHETTGGYTQNNGMSVTADFACTLGIRF